MSCQSQMSLGRIRAEFCNSMNCLFCNGETLSGMVESDEIKLIVNERPKLQSVEKLRVRCDPSSKRQMHCNKFSPI